MNTINKSQFVLRGSLFGLVLIMLVTTSACDSTSAVLEPEAAGTAGMTANLTEKLNLSGRQAEQLREVADKNAGIPGALWYTAAELQKTLTAEQKEKLLANLPEPPFGRANRPGRGMNRPQGMRARPVGPMSPNLEGLDLNLTDEQKEQLRTVREQHRVQMETIRSQRREGSLTSEAIQEQVHAMRESMHAAVEQILTAEQLEKLNAQRPEFEGERPRGRSGPAVGRQQRSNREMNGPMAADRLAEVNSVMIDALGLTTEQQEQMQQIRENQREAATALREQMRAEGADREALQEEFQAKREAMRGEVEAVFTEEQQEIIAIHRALTLEAIKLARTNDGRRGNRRFGRFNR